MPEDPTVPLYLQTNPVTKELEVVDLIPEIGNHGTEPVPPSYRNPDEDPEYERALTAFGGRHLLEDW